jgi:hypothetical protein
MKSLSAVSLTTQYAPAFWARNVPAAASLRSREADTPLHSAASLSDSIRSVLSAGIPVTCPPADVHGDHTLVLRRLMRRPHGASKPVRPAEVPATRRDGWVLPTLTAMLLTARCYETGHPPHGSGRPVGLPCSIRASAVTLSVAAAVSRGPILTLDAHQHAFQPPERSLQISAMAML